IRANLKSLGLSGQVRQESVERLSRAAPEGPPYDVCFADPPYAYDRSALAAGLVALAAEWLATGAVVVVERATRDPDWDWPEGFSAARSRRYGDATLWYGHKS